MTMAFHTLVVLLYALLPALMLAGAAWRCRRRHSVRPLLGFLGACLVAVVLSYPVVLLNTMALGRIGWGQRALLLYVILASIGLLRLFDKALFMLVFRLLRVRLSALGQPMPPTRGRAMAGLLLQRLILVAIAIPYAVSLLAVYRPKASVAGDPQSRLGRAFQTASFAAADGVQLDGWWLPAALPRPADPAFDEEWGRRTVVLCHGLASNKLEQLPLAAYLADHGLNVLMFDFRAHGRSGGQLTTFGDLERRDVLAALDYVQQQHKADARRLYGIGTNMGAAALLAAAMDSGAGQSLDGLVLYEPYAKLDAVLEADGQQLLPKAIAWLSWRVGVPLASLHVGSNLSEFVPGRFVDQLWPRPLLVVHGDGQGFVPFVEGMEIYQTAFPPKRQFWPAAGQDGRARGGRGHMAMFTDMLQEFLGTREPLSDDPGVRRRTVEFLRSAQPVPVL